jgi:hypothetical protein
MYQKIAVRLVRICCVALGGLQVSMPLALADTLPPVTDLPEEVLRAEIITEARSPIDGKPLSAAEFAELVLNVERQLDRDAAVSAVKSPEIKDLLFLIRLRGFLRSVGIPIK